MFDIVIRGASIVDGSGRKAFPADIGIQGDGIADIGDLSAAQSGRFIEAKGLVASPGFIDMHTHSDLPLLVNPKAESKIRQGVTTEVIGNCGSSPAPLDEAQRQEAMSGSRAYAGIVSWKWSSFADYLAELRGQGTALNVFPLVGHGRLRAGAMGYEGRPAKAPELAAMKAALVQSMEEGACGFSTGLIYPPGFFSTTPELVELARVAAEQGGLYFSHIRGEGTTLLAALEEAIEIGKRARIPVQVAHFKVTGNRNWWKQGLTIALVEKARAEGVDISADVYPYIAGSTSLKTVLPSWMHEGGTSELLKRLADAETRERARQEIARQGLYTDVSYEQIVIASCPRRPEWEGRSVAQIAEERGKGRFDTLVDMLLEAEADISSVHFSMSEENMRLVLRQPWIMIGSDGSSLAPYGELGKGKNHPRNYGTFPRVLGRYVREEGILSLEEAIRHMAALPAQKLGLKDRGELAKGKKADIVLFNPDTVIDRATFTDPYQYPEGIEYVLVNGEVVIERGEHTGVLPGRILSRG